jgi:dihydroorotate dehydrogenase (NAD+) catalytic subunit
MDAVSPRELTLTIGNVTLENRVLLASGPAGYGLEYEGLLDPTKPGGVVTKTITYEPRSGNRGIRLQETRGGLLNSVGLENIGAENFFSDKMPEIQGAGISVIVSLAAEDWDDFDRLLGAAAAQEQVDIVELNLSCPNVERGGMAVGSDPELLGRYIEKAKEILSRAVIIAKLTPNVGDISTLAVVAEQAGADCITAVNTVVGMDIDTQKRKPVFEMVRAGLSGPAIMPVALEAVWRICGSVDIPVLGAGGISSVDDAVKFFMAGAEAVQIGTAIFYDPGLPERIIAWLGENGVPDKLER